MLPENEFKLDHGIDRNDHCTTLQSDSDLSVVSRELEKALATHRPGMHAWCRAVAVALRSLHHALEEHIFETENPDGLFAEIEIVRPTLGRRVARLREEHRALRDRAESLRKEIAQGWPNVARVRRQARRLLEALRAHVRREADVIFDAFGTDLGVGD